MSFHYPRRVKDLPRLELDSEDEFNTPLKAKTNPEKSEQRQVGNVQGQYLMENIEKFLIVGLTIPIRKILAVKRIH